MFPTRPGLHVSRASLYLYEHRPVSTVQRSKRMQNLCALTFYGKIRIKTVFIRQSICVRRIDTQTLFGFHLCVSI